MAWVVLWQPMWAFALDERPPTMDDWHDVVLSGDGRWQLEVDVWVSELVLMRGGRRHAIRRFENGVGSFKDFNGDGQEELVLTKGCGVVNCVHEVFLLDAAKGRAVLALRYTGDGQKIGDRWMVSWRDGMEYWTSWYSVLDWRRLKVGKRPIASAVALAAEGKCKLTFPPSASERADVKDWLQQRCFPGAAVQFGWHP